MPFQIIRNDITKVKADAIVNTANPKPTYMAGTDSAIYKAAGEKLLLEERKKIGAIEPGSVAVTPAFALKAKYIIHTVGPAWIDGEHGEFDILRNCYNRSLNKAAELGCESIAFPLIATGVYGFPKDKALRIAIDEISHFLMREDTDMMVKLVVFDDKAFVLSKNVFFQVESYIDDEEIKSAYRKEYGIGEPGARRRLADGYSERLNRTLELEISHIAKHNQKELEETRAQGKAGTVEIDEEEFRKAPSDDLSFQKHLIALLNEKDIDNVTAYKRSNVSKGAFSKIMCGDTKTPKKSTVLALCIGLKLDVDESKQLLASADMGFNPYSKRDKLVLKYILQHNYDLSEINIVLYTCQQPLLGG